MNPNNNTYYINTGSWATCLSCSGQGCTYIPDHECDCEFCWKRENLFKKVTCLNCGGSGVVFITTYIDYNSNYHHYPWYTVTYQL